MAIGTYTTANEYDGILVVLSKSTSSSSETLEPAGTMDWTHIGEDMITISLDVSGRQPYAEVRHTSDFTVRY